MKIKQISNYSFLLLGSFFLFAEISCSTRIGIQILEPSSESIQCTIQPAQTLESTIRSFSGAQEEKPLYNESIFSEIFKKAGFTIDQMSFPNNSGIDLTIQTGDMHLPGCTVTENSFTWSITPPIMQEILALAPSETTSYADLLMAPIITGEELTTKQYNDFIASMYGTTLGTELKDSNVIVSFTTPQKIVSATIEPENSGSIKIVENSAEFTLPLDTFLSLFSGVKFCIQWNN